MFIGSLAIVYGPERSEAEDVFQSGLPRDKSNGWLGDVDPLPTSARNP